MELFRNLFFDIERSQYRMYFFFLYICCMHFFFAGGSSI